MQILLGAMTPKSGEMSTKSSIRGYRHNMMLMYGSLCIPGGMKPYLEKFDDMKPALQEFVLSRVKRCDGISAGFHMRSRQSARLTSGSRTETSGKEPEPTLFLRGITLLPTTPSPSRCIPMKGCGSAAKTGRTGGRNNGCFHHPSGDGIP